MPKTYNRNLNLSKFYTSARSGEEGYNPTIILYYNVDGDLIQIDEGWNGKVFRQTVSGTKAGGGVIDQIIDYEVHYSPWSKL